MFRVAPRVLEGTRPLISSLYLPYSIIEGSKLAQAASGDDRSKDATVRSSRMFRMLLARYVLCVDTHTCVCYATTGCYMMLRV